MADVTLYLLCGKIAAGKSTQADKLASQPNTVLIAQDEWLSTLYPDELNTLDDYIRCSTRLNAVMGTHVEVLLRAGLSVVLDFPANTVKSRQWMKTIFERAGVAHALYYLDVPDAECKRRLRQRNEGGSHEFAPTEADFDLFTSYFVPPAQAEGFNVITIRS